MEGKRKVVRTGEEYIEEKIKELDRYCELEKKMIKHSTPVKGGYMMTAKQLLEALKE